MQKIVGAIPDSGADRAACAIAEIEMADVGRGSAGALTDFLADRSGRWWRNLARGIGLASIADEIKKELPIAVKDWQ
jgi:hypothetical protein